MKRLSKNLDDLTISILVGILYRMEKKLCFTKEELSFVQKIATKNTTEYDKIYDKYIKNETP